MGLAPHTYNGFKGLLETSKEEQRKMADAETRFYCRTVKQTDFYIFMIDTKKAYS